MLGSASAQTIGLAMPNLKDPFPLISMKKIEEASVAEGYRVATTDAGDLDQKQTADVQSLIDAKVDVLVVMMTGRDVAKPITEAAAAARIPVVFLNRKPADEALGPRAVYVGSDEKESGTLQAKEVCRLLGGKGSIVVLMGILSQDAAKTRTHDVHEVLATPECSGIQLLEEQSANWSQAQAAEIMQSFLAAGIKPNAVIANNDNMALGALDALAEAGAGRTIVAGIDASDGALKAMTDGRMAVTILQDFAGQGLKAAEVALRLAKGEDMPTLNWVPFQLIRPEDAARLAAERLAN